MLGILLSHLGKRCEHCRGRDGHTEKADESRCVESVEVFGLLELGDRVGGSDDPELALDPFDDPLGLARPFVICRRPLVEDLDRGVAAD